GWCPKYPPVMSWLTQSVGGLVILGHRRCYAATVQSQANSAGGLGLDRGLVDQHDWNSIAHRINAMALLALQTFRSLAVFQVCLAGRAYQHFEQVFGEHCSEIIQKHRSQVRKSDLRSSDSVVTNRR